MTNLVFSFSVAIIRGDARDIYKSRLICKHILSEREQFCPTSLRNSTLFMPIRWICWFQNRFEKIQVSITSQAANTSMHLAKFNVKADNKSLNLQRFLSLIRVEKKERGKKNNMHQEWCSAGFHGCITPFFEACTDFWGGRKHGRDRITIWYGFDLQKHDLEDLQCRRD